MTTLSMARTALERAHHSTTVRAQRGENTAAVDQLLGLGVAELQRAATLKGLQRAASIRRIDSLLKMAVGHGIERTYSPVTQTRWGKGR